MLGTPIAKGVWLVNAGVKFAPDLEAEKNAHNSVKESEVKNMETTKEEVEDAELSAIVAEQENRKSKWVKPGEVQKRDMEMMEVDITGEATKKSETFNGKPYTSLEVPVKDPEGEDRIVSLSGANILRVANGDKKYLGLGHNRKLWIGNKLRLKAVASEKTKSGFSLQIVPLKKIKVGEKSPSSSFHQDSDIEAFL